MIVQFPIESITTKAPAVVLAVVVQRKKRVSPWLFEAKAGMVPVREPNRSVCPVVPPCIWMVTVPAPATLIAKTDPAGHPELGRPTVTAEPDVVQ